MKKIIVIRLFLIVPVILLGACVPITFTSPIQLHVTAGDQVIQAVIAMDAAGRSHIAGVVNDRIVYYRTRFGEPILTLTMTMSGSGTNWKQYGPDIAVTNNGTAYVTWVE
jgi:hypothetical protein